MQADANLSIFFQTASPRPKQAVEQEAQGPSGRHRRVRSHPGADAINRVRTWMIGVYAGLCAWGLSGWKPLIQWASGWRVKPAVRVARHCAARRLLT